MPSVVDPAERDGEGKRAAPDRGGGPWANPPNPPLLSDQAPPECAEGGTRETSRPRQPFQPGRLRGGGGGFLFFCLGSLSGL